MTVPLAVAVGTAALPGLAVAGDLNTGLWSPGADTLAVSTGGVERLRIDNLGNAGFGVAAPSAVYRMHIRTPYGATGGGLLIDNEADQDLRYSITIKAGLTTQGRRYIYFREFNQDAGWLMGSNQSNDFILYNGNGHKIVGDGGVNGDTSINASGTGAVKINVGGSVGGGTGGLTLYSGDVNQTRWLSSDSAGTRSWEGFPFQARSPNAADYIEMKCENGLARIVSDTKVTMQGDLTDTLTLSNGRVGIGTTSPAVTLDVIGQVGIGVAGAHSTDYGLTIRNGTFTGSDGYVLFVNGPSATEFGRLAVNQDGLMTLGTSTAAAFNIRTNNTDRWQWSSAGHYLPVADATYNIGTQAANRPDNVFAATKVVGRFLQFYSTGTTLSSYIQSSTDGIITMFNAAGNGFTRLNFGGNTATEPSIKRSGAGLHFVLADDSGWAAVQSGNFTANGGITATGSVGAGATNGYSWLGRTILRSPADGSFRILNNAETISATLVVEAANVLALRDGANAQAFRVYNTFTDASNYERGTFSWSANVLTISTDNAGTGGNRGILIAAKAPLVLESTLSAVFLKTNGNNRWSATVDGHFHAAVDNTLDIGASGASRPRHAYIGTKVSIANAALGGNALDVFSASAGTLAAFQSNGLVSGNSVISINMAAVTGTVTGVNAIGDTSVSWVSNLQNNGAGNARWQTLVIGAGDPLITFEVNGVTSWAAGLDNSDSDAFVISQSTGLGTNNRLRIATDGVTTLYNNLLAAVDATYDWGASGSGRFRDGFLSRNLTVGTAISAGNSVRVNGTNAGFFSLGTADDVLLNRDAANILALRNGANAQAFRVYNTFTDGSNHERGFMRWAGNEFLIGTEKAGTGSARLMVFQTDGVSRWFMDGAGNLLAAVDNTYNIGASGSSRARDIFAGRNIIAGGRLEAATYVSFLNAAQMFSPSVNDITLYNSSANGFGLLQFGGATSGFPAWKRSTTKLQARLADDSAFTLVQGQLQTHNNAVAETPTATHTLTLYDAAGTAYKVLAVAA